MEVFTAEAYSILAILNGAILSKSGAITLAYHLDNPEPYTLDKTSLEARHRDFMRALKLPAGSYFHKQDVFLKKRYDGSHITGNSFIQQAERAHFSGRLYLQHHSIIAFTLTGLETLVKSYEQNPVAYKSNLVKKDRSRLDEFLEAVEGAITVIKAIPDTATRPLTDEELRYYIYHYVNAFTEGEGLKDIHFGQRLEIGEAAGAFFAITDETYLPDQLPVFIPDDTLPGSNATLSMSYLEKLGLHIKANHIYNQIIYFEGHNILKEALHARVQSFARAVGFSGGVEVAYKRLKEFETEVTEEQAVLCRAHFSVMVWDNDPQELSKAKDVVREALRTRDIHYYEPGYEGLRNLFIGTIIGRENKLAPVYFFLTELGVALTLFINYSVYKDDLEGILFNDRIFQVPLRKDIWDTLKKRMPARNGIVVSGTGGGKSSAMQSMVQQYIEQHIIPIVIEFGKSFENLTRLYPELSAHIQYDDSTPLGINPFYIQDEKEITADKLKTLAVIVLKFWRVKEVREDTKQVVSLTKILRDYYDHTHVGHSFADFYQYVKNNYQQILDRQEIPAAFFDLDSFLHVCSDFLPGGTYENVCNLQGTNEDKIRNKNFVVFELSAIKKDPFLVSLIMTIIYETVENKILADRSKKGVIILDEYAETAQLKDNLGGENIHMTVAFFFQKLRKENGAIISIIQSPAQLPEDNFTQGIIANTQLLYVLPTTETVYDQVEAAFHLKNKAHINLMKSIKNDFAGKRPYSEIFIRFMDDYATVVRLEFSPQKYYAFQTEGPDWQYLANSYKETGSIEQSIDNLIQSKSHEKIIH